MDTQNINTYQYHDLSLITVSYMRIVTLPPLKLELLRRIN